MAEDVILNFSPPRPRPVSTANIKNKILSRLSKWHFSNLINAFTLELERHVTKAPFKNFIHFFFKAVSYQIFHDDLTTVTCTIN